ncbi:MAG: ribonuclease E/G, partial [Geminicoccaceae bacterium]
LFHHYQIEPQLDALHSPVVDLKSGGSIVINPTEALTAIDVNSGRATRERNIEETALRTNSEAAEEIARQLRLRDVAGLVVIDFIDMTEMRNQRIVERRLRDALRFDRARIQLGRISTFGLLELSRQRLRPSFLEMSTQPCPICAGSGTIRSVESAALQALRAVEIEGMKGGHRSLSVALPVPVALYLLNQKRDQVVSLEQRYGIALEVKVGDELIAGHFEIDTVAAPSEETEEEPAEPKRKAASRSRRRAEDPAEESTTNTEASAGEDDGQRKRRRRRRRRRRSGEGEEMATTSETRSDSADSASSPSQPEPMVTGEDDEDSPVQVTEDEGIQADGTPAAEEEPRSGRRRRRSSPRGRRRGGSSRRAAGAPQPAVETNGAARPDVAPSPTPEATAPQPEAFMPAVDQQPEMAEEARERRPIPPEPEFAGLAETTLSSAMVAEAATPPEAEAADQNWADQRNRRESEHDAAPEDDADIQQAAIITEPAEPRRGWWNRFVRKSD